MESFTGVWVLNLEPYALDPKPLTGVEYPVSGHFRPPEAQLPQAFASGK